ncbi:MAG: 16S rRNA (guanine(527)-N(7))-methyltransferase RsmG [Arcobacteraceae bacterium]|nr:16S rRNA (guanine(527)-N(7))-methyltransferase RsmG [Arcobacteraceae bacterium]
MENEQLKIELEKIKLSFDDKFYERCDTFISLLQEWGAVHNFTSAKALRTPDIIANIVDSVYPLKFLNDFKSFADVGTGAGYPGMLLAIARPDTKCVLVEPKVKRVAFLNFVKSALGLKKVTVLHTKVQDISPTSYDLITSRAVTNTSLLLSLTQNISNEQTEFIFYKGSLCEQEIEEIKLNKYEIISVGEFRNFLYIKRKGLFE